MCTFTRFIQFDIETDIEMMKRHGIWNGNVPLIYNALICRINRKDSVLIDSKPEPRGVTISISQDKLADNAGITIKRKRVVANEAIQKMEKAGILEKEDGDFHNTFKYLMLSQKRANDLRLEELDSLGKEGVRPSEKGVRFEDERCTPQSVHNPEYYLEYPEKDLPPTVLGNSTGIAEPMPNGKGEEEGKTDFSNSLKAEANQRTAAESRNGEKHKEKAKASPKKENDDSFFLSESLSFTDLFIQEVYGTSHPEAFDARDVWANQFLPAFRDIYDDPRSSEACGDVSARIVACGEVMRVWLKNVRQGDNPARLPGYLTTLSGKVALGEAKCEVFESISAPQAGDVHPVNNTASIKDLEQWESQRGKIVEQELRNWHNTPPEQRVEPQLASWCLREGVDCESEEAESHRQRLIRTLPITVEDRRAYIASNVVPDQSPNGY